jgi:hypothetical protein
MKRLYANLITIIALITLPWWCVVLLLLVFSVVFDFFEVIVYGLLLDALYAVPGTLLSGHLFLISGAFVYTLSAIIRPNLRNV